MSLVRVHADGQSVNVGESFAKTRGLSVVDEPTHNPDGRVRAASPVSESKPPAAKKAARKPRKRAAAKKATASRPTATTTATKRAETAEEASK